MPPREVGNFKEPPRKAGDHQNHPQKRFKASFPHLPGVDKRGQEKG